MNLAPSPDVMIPRSPRNGLSVEVISTPEALSGLEEQWNELLLKSSRPNPFLHFAWVSSWYRHFGGGKELQIFVVRQEGRPIGIAPFYRKTRRLLGISFRRLSFLGDEEVGSDHLDLISEEGSEDRVARALALRLLETPEAWDLIELSSTSEQSRHLSVLIDTLGGAGWRLWREPTEVCPYVTLGLGWNDYLQQRLSYSMRFTVRRKLRKFDHLPSAEFCIVESPEAGRVEFETLITLHRKRWESEGGSDAFVSDLKTPFHREVAKTFLDHGIARLMLLKIDRETVASMYGFLIKGCFFFYQTGFDPAWQSASPGLVLTAKALEAATNLGWEELDFLRGAGPYKLHWTDTTRRLWTLSLFAPGLKNLVYRVVFSSRGIKGRFKQMRTRDV